MITNQIDSCEKQGIDQHQLLLLTEMEAKKEELIATLASMIRNYALKKHQQGNYKRR
jgi:hypothetical protein